MTEVCTIRRLLRTGLNGLELIEDGARMALDVSFGSRIGSSEA
jgi:hypothetical protein